MEDELAALVVSSSLSDALQSCQVSIEILNILIAGMLMI